MYKIHPVHLSHRILVDLDPPPQRLESIFDTLNSELTNPKMRILAKTSTFTEFFLQASKMNSRLDVEQSGLLYQLIRS